MEKVLRGLFNLIRILLIKAKCGSKVIIYPVQPMRFSSQLMIKKNIKSVNIGKNFKLESNAKLRVLDDARLNVGDNCFVNCGAYITVMGETSIGNGCLIGPNVMIFDHDHDFRAEGGITSNVMKIGKVSIGDNVWIGAGSIILQGADIGNNAVIAAGSIVKGRVEPCTLFVQKRETTRSII